MLACSCGREFTGSPTLYVHQRLTGHCFCQLCTRQFDTEHFLALHNIAVHDQSQSNFPRPDTSLPRKPEAKNQSKNQTENRSGDQTENPSKKKKKKSFACPQCARSFSGKGPRNTHCSVPHPHQCGACSRAYISLKSLHSHNRSTAHCFCGQCDLCFPDLEALAEHRQTFIHASGFHCCDCDRDFVSQKALDHHLQFKIHKPTQPRRECYECDECRRQFLNQAALDKHRASLVHHPLSDLKCFASSECRQRFNSPSALIQHLESGNCKSGLTRRSLNRLVQRNDTDRLISSGVEEHDPLAELHHQLDSLTIASHPIRTPDSSKESTPIMTPVTDDDDSGVMLSPYLGMMSPILSPLDIAAHHALVSLEDQNSTQKANGLSCPLCPARSKPFKTLNALHMHLNSSRHAPKVFHCPSSIFPPTKRKGAHRGSIKHFSSLSGLTMHIESGACRGGKATLQKAIELLEQRLHDMGFEHLHLLK